MEIKIYAPVLIPTLNRYEHFKKCLESLERCTWAEKTTVYVSLDYPPSDKYVEGWKINDRYLAEKEKKNNFKELVVVRRLSNVFFSGRSVYADIIESFDSSIDAYIISEDDNVFATNFLDYMNKALEMYKNNPKVLTISGYNHPEFYNQGDYKTFYSKDSCAWGFGLWISKEKKLRNLLTRKKYFRDAVFSYFKAKKLVSTYPALYAMLNEMVTRDVSWGDVKRATINILEGYYQLHPAISLVRNEGNDGSGEHCGVVDALSNQIISTDKYFDFGEGVGPAETSENIHAFYYQNLSHDHPQEDIRRIELLMCHNAIPFYNQYVLLRHYIHISRIRICRCLGLIK